MALFTGSMNLRVFAFHVTLTILFTLLYKFSTITRYFETVLMYEGFNGGLPASRMHCLRERERSQGERSAFASRK